MKTSFQLFIPPLGSRLRLTQEWSFDLHRELRNHDFREHLGFEDPADRSRMYLIAQTHPRSDHVVLPAGTVLKVDRIYIRKGQDGFDSLSFLIESSPDTRLSVCIITEQGRTRRRQTRFWAKLADVNDMVVELLQEI